MDVVRAVLVTLLITTVSCEEKAANNTKWSTPVAERRSGDWVPLSGPCPTCDPTSQSSEIIDSALPPQLFQQQQQPANIPLFPQQQPQLTPAQFQLLMTQLLQQANGGQFLQPVLLATQPQFSPQGNVQQPRLLPPPQQGPQLFTHEAPPPLPQQNPSFTQQASPQPLPQQSPALLSQQTPPPLPIETPATAPPTVSSNEEEEEDIEDEDGESEGKEEVQLLYVPVETLRQRGRLQQKQKTTRYQSEEQQQSTEQSSLKQQQEGHRFQGQRRPQQSTQQYEQPRLPQQDQRRQQYDQQQQRHPAQQFDQRQQYQQTNNRQRTTPSSTTPNPVHQPPLAVYMDKLGHDVKLTDVVSTLRGTKTISVLDEFGPDSPQIFVGPSNLNPPDGYAKFEIPYLSALESNRVERKVDKLPFFVAPLSFKPPPGYSKIPFPAPHVGSVVVANVTTDRKDIHVKNNEGPIIKNQKGGQYSLPVDLPPINPELPTLVNSLQDSRQPGNVVLVPATEQSQKQIQYSQTQQELRQPTQTLQPASRYIQTQAQTVAPPIQYTETHSQTPEPPIQYTQTQTVQTPAQYIGTQESLQEQQSFSQQGEIPEISSQIPVRSTAQPARPTHFPSRPSGSSTQRVISQSQYEGRVPVYEEVPEIQRENLQKHERNFPRQESPAFAQQNLQQSFDSSQSTRHSPQQNTEPEIPQSTVVQQQFPLENQPVKFDGHQSGYVPQEHQQFQTIQHGFANQEIPQYNSQEIHAQQQTGIQSLQAGLAIQQAVEPETERTTTVIVDPETTTTTVLQTTPSRRGQYRGRQRGTPVSYTQSTTTTSSPTTRRNYSRGGRRPTHSRNRNEESSSFTANQQFRTRLESTSTTPANIYQAEESIELNRNSPTNSFTQNQSPTLVDTSIPISVYNENHNQYQSSSDEKKPVNPSPPSLHQPINLELPNTQVETDVQNPQLLLNNQEDIQSNYYQYTTTTSTTTTSTTTRPEVPPNESDSFQSQRFGSQADNGRRESGSRNQRFRGRGGNYQGRQRQSQQVITTTSATVQNYQPFDPYTSKDSSSSFKNEDSGNQQDYFSQIVSTVPPETVQNPTQIQQQSQSIGAIYNQQPYSQHSDSIASTTENTAVYQPNILPSEYQLPQNSQAEDDSSLTYQQQSSFQQNQQQDTVPALQQQQSPVSQQYILETSQLPSSQSHIPPQQQFIPQYQESSTSPPVQSYPTTEAAPLQPVQNSYSNIPEEYPSTSEASRVGPKYTSFQRTKGRGQIQTANEESSEYDAYSPFQQPSDLPARNAGQRQSATRASYQRTTEATTTSDADTPKPVQVRLRGRIRARQKVTQQPQEPENYPVFHSRDTSKPKDSSRFHNERDQYQSARQSAQQQRNENYPQTVPQTSQDYSQLSVLDVTTQPNVGLQPDQGEDALLTSQEVPAYSFSSTTERQEPTTTTEAASLYRTGGRKNFVGRGTPRRPVRPTTIPPTASAITTTPSGPNKVYTVRPNKRPQAEKPKITTIRGRIRRPTTPTTTTTEELPNYPTAEPNWNKQNELRFSPSAASNEVYDSNIDESNPRGAHRGGQRGRGPTTTSRYQPAFISNLGGEQPFISNVGRGQTTESNYYQFGPLEEDETNPSPQWSSQQGVSLNFKSSANNNRAKYEGYAEEGAESQWSSSRLQYTDSKTSNKDVNEPLVATQEIKDEKTLLEQPVAEYETISNDTSNTNVSTVETNNEEVYLQFNTDNHTADGEKQSNITDTDSYKLEIPELLTTEIPVTESSTTERKANHTRRRGGWIRVRAKHRPQDILETAESQNVATVTNILPATTVKDTAPSPWAFYNPLSEYNNEAVNQYENIRQDDITNNREAYFNYDDYFDDEQTRNNSENLSDDFYVTSSSLLDFPHSSSNGSDEEETLKDEGLRQDIISQGTLSNESAVDGDDSFKSLQDYSEEELETPSNTTKTSNFSDTQTEVKENQSFTNETQESANIKEEESILEAILEEIEEIVDTNQTDLIQNDTQTTNYTSLDQDNSSFDQTLPFLNETSSDVDDLDQNTTAQSLYNETSFDVDVSDEKFPIENSQDNESLYINVPESSVVKGKFQNETSDTDISDKVSAASSSLQNNTSLNIDVHDEIPPVQASDSKISPYHAAPSETSPSEPSVDGRENLLDQLPESNDINNETEDKHEPEGKSTTEPTLRVSYSPPETGQGYLPEDRTGINIHRMKDFQSDPMRFLATSTSTEVSHETEICYRGRCVKTKTAVDQIPME